MKQHKPWWWWAAVACTWMIFVTGVVTYFWSLGWSSVRWAAKVDVYQGAVFGVISWNAGIRDEDAPWYGEFHFDRLYREHTHFVSSRRSYVPGSCVVFELPLVYPFLASSAVIAIPWVVAMVNGFHRRQAGLCVTCAYDLTGKESGICPECGAEIEGL